MNQNIETLRRAIKSLETSVYVFENGMTQSLPWINSKRIDILRGGIRSLSQQIQELSPEGIDELIERITKIEQLLGNGDDYEGSEISNNTTIENVTNIYNAIYNNSTSTTTGFENSPWDVNVDMSDQDIQRKDGEYNPITQTDNTPESIAEYDKNMGNLKTAINEIYKILIYLENQVIPTYYDSIDVFDTMDVE